MLRKKSALFVSTANAARALMAETRFVACGRTKTLSEIQQRIQMFLLVTEKSQ